MSLRKNVAVARKWNEEVINKQDADAITEVLHPQYHWRVGTNGPWSVSLEGVESVRRMWTDLFPKHPGLRVVVEDIFGQGDRVAVRMTHWEGDKPVRNGIAIYRFANGKIIDDWACTTDLK